MTDKTTTDKNVSKTQQLAEAARLRTKVEREAAEQNAPGLDPDREEDAKHVDAMIEAAEQNIAIRPQAVAASLTGKLDPEAMGDVKGDGGDAKDYPEGDPDRALGVPTYEHGLKEVRVGGDDLEAGKRAVSSQNLSPRTLAEMEAGKRALGSSKNARVSVKSGATVVTDASEDPDGTAGATAAEKKAAAAKAKLANS